MLLQVKESSLMEKKSTYNSKYYQRQDKPTYLLDLNKILSEYKSVREFSLDVGVSMALMSSYKLGKTYITEDSKFFENIKDYVILDTLTVQDKKRIRREKKLNKGN